MKNTWTLALIGLFFAFTCGCAPKNEGITPNESAFLLRQLGAELMLYAAMNDESFPRSLDDLKENIEKIEGLQQVIESEDFTYHVSGRKLQDSNVTEKAASFRFPNQGSMVLYVGGNTRWEEQK